MAMIEMELIEIHLSEDGGPQTVILAEKEGNRSFPIFIGPYEIEILDHSIKGKQPQRPLTHDLCLNVMQALGGRLTGVVVDELQESWFHGKLLVKDSDGTTVRVDTRPSDAIVLAMKEGVPIYVEESVLTEVAMDVENDEL